jgi:HEAT repeat protein
MVDGGQKLRVARKVRAVRSLFKRHPGRLILFPVAAALILGTIIVSRDTEPRARGHSLSAWLKIGAEIRFDLSPGDPDTAIREIGERGIPTLLKMLQAKDPPWHEPLYRIVSRIPGWPFEFSWAAEQRDQATYGFACLGPQARSAIPDLAKLLYDTNVTDAAGTALAYIGVESLPVLRDALMNGTNMAAQLVAIHAAFSSSNLAEATLPEMRILRVHTNERVAMSAVGHLMRYAPKEEAHLAAIEAMQSRQAKRRALVVSNLKGANIDHAEVVPMLIQLLDDPDVSLRRRVTNTLRSIDPAAAASVGIETNTPPSSRPLHRRGSR